MALVYQRRLAIPLWAIVFFTVVLTAPPTAALFRMSLATVLAIAAVGISAIVFLMPGAISWLRTARASVRVRPSGHDRPWTAITLTARTGRCTPAEPDRRTADDTLDLVRMDDDGGWQMPRPPS